MNLNYVLSHSFKFITWHWISSPSIVIIEIVTNINFLFEFLFLIYFSTLHALDSNLSVVIIEVTLVLPILIFNLNCVLYHFFKFNSWHWIQVLLFTTEVTLVLPISIFNLNYVLLHCFKFISWHWLKVIIKIIQLLSVSIFYFPICHEILFDDINSTSNFQERR